MLTPYSLCLQGDSWFIWKMLHLFRLLWLHFCKRHFLNVIEECGLMSPSDIFEIYHSIPVLPNLLEFRSNIFIQFENNLLLFKNNKKITKTATGACGQQPGLPNTWIESSNWQNGESGPEFLSEGSHSAKRCQHSLKMFASKLLRCTSKQYNTIQYNTIQYNTYKKIE